MKLVGGKLMLSFKTVFIYCFCNWFPGQVLWLGNRSLIHSVTGLDVQACNRLSGKIINVSFIDKAMGLSTLMLSLLLVSVSFRDCRFNCYCARVNVKKIFEPRLTCLLIFHFHPALFTPFFPAFTNRPLNYLTLFYLKITLYLAHDRDKILFPYRKARYGLKCACETYTK